MANSAIKKPFGRWRLVDTKTGNEDTISIPADALEMIVEVLYPNGNMSFLFHLCREQLLSYGRSYSTGYYQTANSNCLCQIYSTNSYVKGAYLKIGSDVYSSIMETSLYVR